MVREQSPRQPRVLVIDDDEAVRLRIADLLSRGGKFLVSTAVDGSSGLAAARRLAPDLILLDLMMPGMSGLDVCTRLREDAVTGDVPVLILSAAEESEAMLQAIRAGAEDFLSKPVDSAELLAKALTITRLDRSRALRVERERLRWLVDQSQDALVLIQCSGTIFYANAAAKTLFGIVEGEGGDIVEIVGAHFRADPPDAWQRLRARAFAAVPDDSSFAIYSPENEYVAARWLEVEIHAADEDSAGAILLKFRDRSNFVQRESEIWSFQHMISHKIRTPLNGLGGVLDLVASSPAWERDPDTLSLLNIARESAARLEQSLLSVLQFHEARYASRPYRPDNPEQRVNVGAVVRRIVADMEFPVGEVLVEGEADASLDSRRRDTLTLVLTETLSNSRKFARLEAERTGVPAPPTNVRIRVHSKTEGAIHVVLPGPTLRPDVLARLGEPYWQLERRATGEVPGMGLGLATARLVMQSGGGGLTISNHADPPGLVTTLTVPWDFPS